MQRHMILIEIDENYSEEIFIRIKPHARKRMGQRTIDNNAVYGSILSMGERLLELKNNEEFIILDEFYSEAIVCGISIEDTDIMVDVMTVVDTDKVFAKKGQRIFKISDLI